MKKSEKGSIIEPKADLHSRTPTGTPNIGRFTSQDSVRYSERSLPTGNITDPLSLNYYVYSLDELKTMLVEAEHRIE